MTSIPDLDIYTGASQGPEACTLIAGPHAGPSNEEPQMAIIQWSARGGFHGFAVDRSLTRIEPAGDESGTMICSSPMGNVCVVRNDDALDEHICPEGGPQIYGYICALRKIGDHLFAAGMGRQVYRRQTPGRWISISNGILDDSEDILDIHGFTSLDGTTEDNLWAVGHRGEIWHYRSGEWMAADTLTNLLLYGVRIHHQAVWACGQAGILLRGSAQQWEIVEQDVEPDDFVAIESFLNSLYLIGSVGIMRLDPDGELATIDEQLHESDRFRTLHVGSGALWAFGPRVMACTTDGNSWREIDFKPELSNP